MWFVCVCVFINGPHTQWFSTNTGRFPNNITEYYYHSSTTTYKRNCVISHSHPYLPMHPSILPSVCPSACPSIHPSIHPSTTVSIYLYISIYLYSIYLFIYLYIYQYIAPIKNAVSTMEDTALV